MWGRLVSYFTDLHAIRTSIPQTELLNRPVSDDRPVFDLSVFDSPISGQAVRVIWPERPGDLQWLSDWVDERLKVMADGKFVTIAFDSERVGMQPLCIQIGDIFTDERDPAIPRWWPHIVPPIRTTNAVIVFCLDSTGKPMYDEISLLSQLFNNDRITIATFDFVMDLIALEQIGICYRKDRTVDCQLYGLPRGEQYLTYTHVNSLAMRMESLEIEDPMLSRAQEIGVEGKHFPWNANHFIMVHDSLPPTSLVTKRFLEYSASDIVMTSLAYAEIIHKGGLDIVMSQTQEKLAEYEEAQSEFGKTGPYLVRQWQFVRRDWPVLRDGVVWGASNDILLERWSKLRLLCDLARSANGAFSDPDVTEERLTAMIESTATILNEPERLADVRFIAQLSCPPASNRY
jgi:hypothetical protein